MDIGELTSLTGIYFKQISPAGHSQWASSYNAETTGGERLFIKYSHSADSGGELEAWMLQQLAAAGMPVPEIVYFDDKHLLLEYIEGSTRLSGEAEIHAAQFMAKLHSCTSTFFGHERNTILGALDQPNDKSRNWAEFFRDKRLMHSAVTAFRAGQIGRQRLDKIRRIADNIRDYLTEDEKPSLVHGDMWGGNLIARGGKVRAFIDPAIYYADAETELAFAMMFGSFGNSFFDAYNEINPIKPGFFETRRYLYNLYPVLVHVLQFGDGYLSMLDSHMDKLS